jgi:PAS domain S-box-containing protein
MPLKNKKSGEADILRSLAEAELKERKKKTTSGFVASEIDHQRIVHELEVYQIELEMQNEALKRSREEMEVMFRQYSDLYDFAPVGYFTLAPDGLILQVNLSGTRLLGVERDLLIRRHFGAFVSVGSRTIFNTFIKDVFEKQEKENCEVELQKDGSASLWVYIEAIIEDGQHERCRAVVVDITERKNAEEKVRLAHDRLRRFVDANIIGVLVATPTGKVIETNDYYLRLIGYSRTEFEEGLVNWRAITPLEWLPADNRAIEEMRKQGTCTPYEKEYARRDGTRVAVLLSDAMLPGPEEQIVAFALDITDRKQAAKDLLYHQELMTQMGRVAKIGGWEFDPRTGKGTWTEECARIHDLDPQDQTDAQLGLSFYYGESRLKTEQAIKEATEHGKSYDLELELTTAKGVHK